MPNKDYYKAAVIKCIKPVSVLIVCVAIAILCHRPIEKLLAVSFVSPVLSKVDSTWYNDIIVITLLVFLAIPRIIKRHVQPSPINTIFILVFLCAIYLLYRIFSHKWIFTEFHYLPALKYIDTLIAVLVFEFSLFIIERTKELPANSRDSFHEDVPLDKNGKDEYGYADYVKQLSKRVSNSYFKHSFAVGINAKWGFGKSSFISLLKESLDGSNGNFIQVNFNPWNSFTQQAIIKDFFDTVQESINPHNSGLASLLRKYSDKLVELNDNSLTKSIKFSSSIFLGNESLETLFKNINSSLEKIDKKLIVYVDDLDRLDSNEIIEVLRLIRNTANFHNTFFIVAYDRDYVINALKNHNAYNKEKFLEKIFQLEVTLPHFKKEIFLQKLCEKLKKGLDEKYSSKIESAILGTTTSPPLYLSDWLESMRDVTRLSNSVLLNLENIVSEVEINDFVKLEVLRFKFPSVYELLYQKKSIFLTTKEGVNSTNKYRLADSKEIEGVSKERENERYLLLYLEKNYSDLGVPENKVRDIVSFIEEIFPSGGWHSYRTKDMLSVVYTNKFDRYFSYSLFPDVLSEAEFINAIELDQAALNEAITDWVNRGLVSEAQKRFLLFKDFDSREQFEKIIKAIFHLARHEHVRGAYYNVHGYNSDDLMDKLNNSKVKKPGKFYKDVNALIQFIKSILDEAPFPYSFESDFVHAVLGRLFQPDMFPLTSKELSEQAVSYLKKYCDQANDVDVKVYKFFWNTELINYSPGNGNIINSEKGYPPEAVAIFKTFVEKHLNTFILWSVQVEHMHQRVFAVANSVFKIFGGWVEFEEFLSAQDEQKWDRLSEFKQFFLEFKEKGLLKFIPFDFKVIPIKENMRTGDDD